LPLGFLNKILEPRNQEISNAVKKFKTDLAQKVEKDNASL